MHEILQPPDENGLIVWTNPPVGNHTLSAFSTKIDEPFVFDLEITDEECQEFIFTIVFDKGKE